MPSLMSKQEFQNRIDARYPNERIIILDYTKSGASGTYQCLDCGQVFSIYRMGDLLRKKHCCNHCFHSAGNFPSTQAKKIKIKSFFKNNKNYTFNKFDYDYENKKNLVYYTCQKCGFINCKTFQEFFNQSACSSCSIGAQKMTTAGLQSRIPAEYALLEEYKGTEKKILIKHLACGFIWKTTPHNLISGCGCPRCAKGRSKGEKKIIQFCFDHKIDFIAEKTFVFSERKRYDFFLPQYNLLIEYHGIQHYQDILFHGQHRLQEIQAVDIWKRQQALAHNFEYLEISYEDFSNIETILAQRLNIEVSS